MLDVWRFLWLRVQLRVFWGFRAQWISWQRNTRQFCNNPLRVYSLHKQTTHCESRTNHVDDLDPNPTFQVISYWPLFSFWPGYPGKYPNPSVEDRLSDSSGNWVICSRERVNAWPSDQHQTGINDEINIGIRNLNVWTSIKLESQRKEGSHHLDAAWLATNLHRCFIVFTFNFHDILRLRFNSLQHSLFWVFCHFFSDLHYLYYQQFKTPTFACNWRSC